MAESELPGGPAARRPELAALEVVGRNVDAAVETREAGVVRRVEVRSPPKRERPGRPCLVPELAGSHRPLEHASWEVRAAGEGGKYLRGRTTERAVPGHEPGKGRSDERRLLVGQPVGGANPAGPAVLGHRSL